MSRAANITSSTINKIIQIIDGWSAEKLTWELLIEEIDRRGHPRYTRQALERKEAIKTAFTARKITLREKRLQTPEINTLAQAAIEIEILSRKLERAEAALARLQLTNDNLNAQFIRWAHNAVSLGISKDVLDAPLPSMNRARSTVTVPNGNKPNRFKVVIERPSDKESADE
ncbi:hypothetical protein [Noviherbaspirillum malthae]|uniref:hypothetical protein n=1 Tax=Noviherbaspirillum malthae TaxID=1260987 RepID=UPI00188FEE5D|nr:hypothetical protein [Noviherbaspirillum malthae]